MAITHARIVTSGSRGAADDWNAEHVVSHTSLPKAAPTFIVAASDSKDTGRADYVCDGVDDDITIQEALDDLPASGGHVHLLDGHYNTTSRININIDHVMLTGCGASSVIDVAKDVAGIYSSKDDITIANLYLAGEYTTGTNTTDGIFLQASTHSLIINVWVRDFNRYGINSMVNLYTTIMGCWLYSNQSHNLYSNNDNKCTFVNNVCRNGGSAATSSSGIYIAGSDYCIISGNQCSMNNDRGIYISNVGAIKNIVLGNALTNNTAANFTDNGTNTEVAHNVTA